MHASIILFGCLEEGNELEEYLIKEMGADFYTYEKLNWFKDKKYREVRNIQYKEIILPRNAHNEECLPGIFFVYHFDVDDVPLYRVTPKDAERSLYRYKEWIENNGDNVVNILNVHF